MRDVNQRGRQCTLKMLQKITIVFATLIAVGITASNDWYKNSFVYQIYPRSFKDSNGDGIGDLNGITSELEHIADLNADALWLSPIFTSPQADYGYDISNFTDINPEYGTLDDFDKLVAKAKSLGMKVLLDFVPNHSSDEHQWFKWSVQKMDPYTNYYVWHDGKMVDGVRQPPNNWLSVFGGSAWEWNEERGQYYFHQFVKGQPDLNYRDANLDQEMKDVLSFWIQRGVEGFRIDAINHMFEDTRLLDEPKRENTGLPDDDYEILEHIYTRDQNETYDVLRAWRQLLDKYSQDSNTDVKMILTEAYTTPELTHRYYSAGSTCPFNFMFIGDLNNRSSAGDFKYFIDRYLNNIPKEPQYVGNWVVGNHDNHRVASRFGARRADQISMISTLLPGVTVIYNGDEIGMLDRDFTYEETQDPAGCLAGPDRYHLKSRDPERTPFQWDATVSAGFSTSKSTWLPVNNNYKTLNLQLQKIAPITASHYKVFKSLMALKRKSVIAQGSTQTLLASNNNVFAIIRRLSSSTVALLINLTDAPLTVNASAQLSIPGKMYVYVGSVGTRILPRTRVDATSFTLPGAASVVLVTPDLLK